jgi:hypothetical protein
VQFPRPGGRDGRDQCRPVQDAAFQPLFHPAERPYPGIPVVVRPEVSVVGDPGQPRVSLEPPGHDV